MIVGEEKLILPDRIMKTELDSNIQCRSKIKDNLVRIGRSIKNLDSSTTNPLLAK